MANSRHTAILFVEIEKNLLNKISNQFKGCNSMDFRLKYAYKPVSEFSCHCQKIDST